MSGHNDPGPGREPGVVPEQPSGVSRRSVLRGAAGAGAVAAAARPAARSGAAGPVAGPAANADPVVVYLRDARTGELDVFSGTSQSRFRDPALAARLLRAVQ